MEALCKAGEDTGLDGAMHGETRFLRQSGHGHTQGTHGAPDRRTGKAMGCDDKGHTDAYIRAIIGWEMAAIGYTKYKTSLIALLLCVSMP